MITETEDSKETDSREITTETITEIMTEETDSRETTIETTTETTVMTEDLEITAKTSIKTVTEMAVVTEITTETIIETMTDVISEEMTEMMHRLNQFRIKTENQGKIKYVRTDRSVIRRITKMAEEKARILREVISLNQC